MALLDPIFNPVLLPLLSWNPFLGIVILSFAISLLISLAYKYFTDQDKMKELKEKQKEFQKRMKELRSQPDKMMAVQKEAMATNMEYMKMSLKPTLYTFLPIILIFGWMTAHLAYEPIYPGETYSITAEIAEGITAQAELLLDEGTTLANEGDSLSVDLVDGFATWYLKSDTGLHELVVQVGEVQASKEVLISTDLEYSVAEEGSGKSDIESIKINYNKLRPAGQNFSILGWQPGWLGWYIIFSLFFSLSIRRVMGLH